MTRAQVTNSYYSDLHDHLLTFYSLKLNLYAHKALDDPAIYEALKFECWFELTLIFIDNPPFALKYSKLAYEYCLRLSDVANLPTCKGYYFKAQAVFAKLPPLRFALGDEVEFLHEAETGSEWKLGKVVELYYRELDFDLSFSAPYRLQLLDNCVSSSSTYAWVKADIDRYVRKVGVRSIEGTRYQALLDAKVAELAQVYCSEEFIQDIYGTLAQDGEFVDMVQSVWQIELSLRVITLYRSYVMNREPLVRTDSGYHVPSSEEVIAGIKAYFDPAYLSADATPPAAGEDTDSQEAIATRDSQRVRADILMIFRDDAYISTNLDVVLGVQGRLLRSIRGHTLPFLPTAFLGDLGTRITSSDLSDAKMKPS